MDVVAKDNHLHARTSDAVRRLRAIDRRLSEITINVCGHVPEQSVENAKPLEEHLHEKFDSLASLLNSIEDEMNRLYSAIGSNQLQPAQLAKAASF